ncbi:MAG: protein translocase subunit SecF [Spirochaetes bacterium]|nr:protein translocase subunit SecF [Spirochaetota bacterium]
MKFNIEFLKYRYIAYFVSFLMFSVFLTVTISKGGLNWGIDFVGGVKLTAKFTQKVSTDEIIKTLSAKGVNASVQQIGLDEKNEYIISTTLLTASQSSDESFQKVWEILTAKYTGIQELGVETVGPSVGDYLKKSSGKLVLFAVLMMMIYLAFRFELKFSIGAMIALVHDITLAVLFCGFLGIEINVPVLAAILFIFGYSVNDTIVIFDRIRETINAKNAHTFVDIINTSINSTFSRTILTSFTTLLAVLALYFIGGESINDFAKILLFGIIVGTYSSVYMASPVVNIYSKLIQKKH